MMKGWRTIWNIKAKLRLGWVLKQEECVFSWNSRFEMKTYGTLYDCDICGGQNLKAI